MDEKLRAYKHQWYLDHAEECRAREKQRRKDNLPLARAKDKVAREKRKIKYPGKDAEVSRKFRKDHPERDLELKRKWANNNKEKVSDARKKYIAAHPEQRRADQQRRRALKANSGGAGWKPKDEMGLMADYGNKCVYCGAPANTIDHVVPLALGGKHEIENAVPACGTCNSSKRAKPLLAWMYQRSQQNA